MWLRWACTAVGLQTDTLFSQELWVGEAFQEVKWVGRNFVEQSLGHGSLNASRVPVYLPTSVLLSDSEIFAIRMSSSLYLLLFHISFILYALSSEFLNAFV